MAINVDTTGFDSTLTVASPVNPGNFQIHYTLNQTPPKMWCNFLNAKAKDRSHNCIIEYGSDKLKICAVIADCTEATLRPIIDQAITDANTEYDAWKTEYDAHQADLATAAGTEATDVASINAGFNG